MIEIKNLVFLKEILNIFKRVKTIKYKIKKSNREELLEAIKQVQTNRLKQWDLKIQLKNIQKQDKTHHFKVTKKFEKQYKKLSMNDKNLTCLIIEKLFNDEILKPKYKDHKLKGEYKDFRECHIKPDLLFIYQKQIHIPSLIALAIGTHDELFEKN